MVNNWKTTVTGAVGGLMIYLIGVGPQLPQTRGQWMVFVSGAVLAALGLTAKDFNVVGGTKQAVDSKGIVQQPK